MTCLLCTRSKHPVETGYFIHKDLLSRFTVYLLVSDTVTKDTSVDGQSSADTQHNVALNTPRSAATAAPSQAFAAGVLFVPSFALSTS